MAPFAPFSLNVNGVFNIHAKYSPHKYVNDSGSGSETKMLHKRSETGSGLRVVLHSGCVVTLSDKV